MSVVAKQRNGKHRNGIGESVWNAGIHATGICTKTWDINKLSTQ
jgi:hypothetical protein